MFTIRQALNLPIFTNSKLIAGESGLNKPLRWVYTSGSMPNGSYSASDNDLLILATDQFADVFTRFEPGLISALQSKGINGIVLCHHSDITPIPPDLLTLANQENFPIIRLPSSIAPNAVNAQIVSALVNPDYLFLQQANEIHAELTNLVLRGGKLADLTQVIAQKLNRSILIEDTSLRVIAQSHIGPLDSMRKASVLRERNHPRIAKKLLGKGIYDRLKRELLPILVPPMPDIGMTLGRLVAPIVVDRDIYGYFWIITDGDDRNLIEKVAVQATTVAALMIFKERAVAEAEAALRTSFFEELISGELDPDQLNDQAGRLNFQLNKEHQVILVRGIPASGGNPHSLLQDVEEWFHAKREYPLIQWYDDLVAVIAPAGENAPLSEEMIAEMSHPARELMIGIGNRSMGSNGIRKSYQQAFETLLISRKMGHQQGVFLFKELGLLHWLHRLPPDALEGNVYLHYIDILTKHDQRRNTELVKTLEGYLDNGSNLVDTAKALHIHRNTLVHRLRRIEELTQIELKKPNHRLNLHVAVKQCRLNG